MSKRTGFSIPELLVSVTLLTVVGMGIFSGFRFYNYTAATAAQKAAVLKNLRTVLDYMKHDLLISRGVYDNVSSYYAVTPPLSETTTTSRLVIRVPSVDGSGDFIDLQDEEYIDFYVYELIGDTLVRKTRRSTKGGSVRSTDNFILGDNIDSISFSDGLTNLGSLTPTELKGLRHVQVNISGLVQNQYGGPNDTVELIMNVSFRNYRY
jgi:type II secretory pathway pseudopilin PulG